MIVPPRSHRRSAVVELVIGIALIAVVIAVGSIARFAYSSPANAHDAIDATLARIAAGESTSISVVEEAPEVDALVRGAAAARGRALSIVARNPEAIDAAARTGIVLAGQRGRAYLELLGYRLRWLPSHADTPNFPWARVHERLHCASIRDDSWSPLPGLEYTGRFGVDLPAAIDGSMVFIIGDAIPVEIDGEALDGVPVRLRREVLRSGPDTRVPADFWLGDGNPWSAPGAVVRVTLDALPARANLVSLRLGRRAPRVLARARGFSASAAPRVCAAAIPVEDAFIGDADRSLVVLPEMHEYFAAGWSGAESAVVNGQSRGGVRWMRQDGALLIPSARRTGLRIVARAWPAAAGDGEAPLLQLTVNDVFRAPPIAMRAEPSRYEWEIPDKAWLAGVNELLFHVSHAEANGRALAFERLELFVR